jgi:hypothetical protein
LAAIGVFTPGAANAQTYTRLQVLLPGESPAPGTGSVLTIDYFFVTGQYNYYEQDKNRVDAKLNIDLDKLIPETEYPVAEVTPDAVVQGDAEIGDKCRSKLIALERRHTAFTRQPPIRENIHLCSHWQSTVIGQDGSLRILKHPISAVPLTPRGQRNGHPVAVPQDVNNLYLA